MIGAVLLRGALALASLALIDPGAARAELSLFATIQGGVIEGVVYDSTLAQPLAGARVFLWNTQMFAEAGQDGTFRIDDVPAGRYDMVFFHPRLTALGVSSGRTPIAVEEDARVTVALTTPSMPTIMSLLCETEDPFREHGRAVGYVGDASTGVPLPGARVILQWSEEGEQGRVSRSAQALADSEGWYSLCTLPPGVEIEGRAYFFGKETRQQRFALSAGDGARIDYTMGEVHPGVITGVIRDAESRRGIRDAEVFLVNTPHRGVTDERGQFRIADVAPGAYAMTATHLAYGERNDPISVTGGKEVQVELEMATEPIELAPIVVSVRSEGEIQALAVGGRLISAAEIEAVRARSTDMGDLLAHNNVPGLFVVRAGAQVCLGFRRGQVTMQGGGCLPAQVYINDVPSSDPTIALNLPAEVIDRIILVPPVEAGVMFGVGSAAGVVMVYTRAR